MIDKESFRKTEGRLYRYYNTLQKIKCLNLECTDLELQRERIRKDIKETNVTIDEESKAITYEERVQASSSGTSYAERALIQEIEKLEQEWIYVRKKLLKKRLKIRELEREISSLKSNIQMLSEENHRFIELKYGDKKSIEEVADFLNMARTTAYRRREELVEDIAKWMSM
jgi:DNA-directed RNA polymerase specialized sigma subunit